MVGIGAAMAFLRRRCPQIVYGDLKDSNIFVEETKHSRPHGGTVHWMPPEMALTNLVPNTKLDVFSFGRVIFFTVTGTLPHRNMIESAHVPFCISFEHSS